MSLFLGIKHGHLKLYSAEIQCHSQQTCGTEQALHTNHCAGTGNLHFSIISSLFVLCSMMALVLHHNFPLNNKAQFHKLTMGLLLDYSSVLCLGKSCVYSILMALLHKILEIGCNLNWLSEMKNKKTNALNPNAAAPHKSPTDNITFHVASLSGLCLHV